MPGWTPAKHRGPGQWNRWSWSSAMIKKQLATEKERKSLLSSFTLRESMEEEKICLIMKLNISHVSWCFGSKVLPLCWCLLSWGKLRIHKAVTGLGCLSRLMYNISLLCPNWFPDRYPHIRDEESKTRQLEIFEFLKSLRLDMIFQMFGVTE